MRKANKNLYVAQILAQSCQKCSSVNKDDARSACEKKDETKDDTALKD